MKNNNIWRVIWVVGIYAVLILILLLVVNYKVEWESKDLNTYLYFYKCSDDVCSSSTEQINYYGRILCENDVCPYIKEKNENILILSDNIKSWLYDYKKDTIVNNTYVDYQIFDENYIVTNDVGKQGVIDLEGNILVDFKYNVIDGYRNNFVVYQTDNKYGIINDKKNINVDAIYDNIVLINDSMYAYMKDNKFYIANYSNNELVNSIGYDYIYSNGNVILVVKDKKIDILNSDLKSLLLMKIDTYYSYERGQERDSLNVRKNGSYLTFSVYSDNEQFDEYIFDMKNNKLL